MRVIELQTVQRDEDVKGFLYVIGRDLVYIHRVQAFADVDAEMSNFGFNVKYKYATSSGNMIVVHDKKYPITKSMVTEEVLNEVKEMEKSDGPESEYAKEFLANL